MSESLTETTGTVLSSIVQLLVYQYNVGSVAQYQVYIKIEYDSIPWSQ